MDTKYNGWENYETWNVNLWLTNEESTDSELTEMAQNSWNEAEADKTFTREENAVFALADTIKEWVEEMTPELPASMFSDLLGAALGSVDWREIAENHLEDVEKEEVTE